MTVKGTLVTDLTGKRFHHLVALRRSERKFSAQGNYYWWFKCDCGNVVEILPSAVMKKKNGTKSCGHLLKAHKLPDGESNLNALIWTYKLHARKRGHEYSLSRAKFAELTKQNCFYCGSPPLNVTRKKDLASEYKFNGIDRVDNSIGYTDDNCVPCCKKCNYMKRGWSVDDFIAHISKIYGYSVICDL